MSVCSLSYPACKEHASHFHLWSVRFYSICPHYPTHGTNFGKNNRIKHKMCSLIFSADYVRKILILIRTERVTLMYLYWSSCKVSVILVIFKWNLNFFYIFSKNTEISNLLNIFPVGSGLFHADGQRRTDKQVGRQADMTERIIVFRNFANATNKHDSYLNVVMWLVSVSRMDTRNPRSRDLEKLIVP